VGVPVVTIIGAGFFGPACCASMHSPAPARIAAPAAIAIHRIP
jgi:hypothetical protein